MAAQPSRSLIEKDVEQLIELFSDGLAIGYPPQNLHSSRKRLGVEDKARWMIKHNLTKEKNMPDFLEYIYEDALKAIKPEAVSMIR